MTDIIAKQEIVDGEQPTGKECAVDPDVRIEPECNSSVVRRPEKTSVDPDCRRGSHDVAFGGLTHVEKIADVQYGGTCWAEAIQKAIQLTLGDKTGQLNNLSTEVIAKVFNDPQKWGAVEDKNAEKACERWNIPSNRYVDMLKEFGVDAENRSFSHDELQSALKDRRPVLIGGDVRYLDGLYGDAKGGHVLLAVDWEPDTGKYVLLDSNFDHVYKVSPKTLEKFAKGTFEDKIANFLYGNMTVVKTPSMWPDWRNFADGKWDYYVDGRKVVSPFDQLTTFAKFDKHGDIVSFSGRRDDILREIKQAQSDIEYHSQRVADLTRDKREGWIVDSSLQYEQGCVASARQKLSDLQRDLAYAKS